MEAGTLALIRAGAGRQVCQRFVYLGSDESNWTTIREEIARDFRGHPDAIYDELIDYCQRVLKCLNAIQADFTPDQIREVFKANIPEVRQT